MTVKQIKLTDIIQDETIQQRVKPSLHVIKDYKAHLEEKGEFPPIEVFECQIKNGDYKYLIGDGWHRYRAYKGLRTKKIKASIVATLTDLESARRAARLHATQANKTQLGLPRTQADKKKAVLTLLNDSEWAEWSDNKIATHCGVSHTFVSKIRQNPDATCNVASWKIKEPAEKQQVDAKEPAENRPDLTLPDRPEVAAEAPVVRLDEGLPEDFNEPPPAPVQPRRRTYTRAGKQQVMDTAKIGQPQAATFRPAHHLLTRFEGTAEDVIRANLTAEEAQRAINKAADLIRRLTPTAGAEFVQSLAL